MLRRSFNCYLLRSKSYLASLYLYVTCLLISSISPSLRFRLNCSISLNFILSFLLLITLMNLKVAVESEFITMMALDSSCLAYYFIFSSSSSSSSLKFTWYPYSWASLYFSSSSLTILLDLNVWLTSLTIMVIKSGNSIFRPILVLNWLNM